MIKPSNGTYHTPKLRFFRRLFIVVWVGAILKNKHLHRQMLQWCLVRGCATKQLHTLPSWGYLEPLSVHTACDKDSALCLDVRVLCSSWLPSLCIWMHMDARCCAEMLPHFRPNVSQIVPVPSGAAPATREHSLSWHELLLLAQKVWLQVPFSDSAHNSKAFQLLPFAGSACLPRRLIIVKYQCSWTILIHESTHDWS